MNFIGTDVHVHSFTVACINSELDIITLEEMKTESLIDYINRANREVIAIDAPYGPNLGYMNDASYRKALDKKLKGHYNKKVGEYELSRRGIMLYNTPQDIEEITGWKAWMRSGIELYGKLASIGYLHLNEDNNADIQNATVEVFPHACFTTICGYIPSSKTTVEGINERIKILESLGFTGVSNITGNRQIISDKLDALVAAYTALKIYKKKALFLGDKREGQIALPVTKIKDKCTYSKKATVDNKPDAAVISKPQDTYEYEYVNVDSAMWLKYFTPTSKAPDVYELIDLKNYSDMKIYANIISEDKKYSVEAILQPIKKSTHGMIAVHEYKEALKKFWGVHGDKRKYKVIIGVVTDTC